MVYAARWGHVAGQWMAEPRISVDEIGRITGIASAEGQPDPAGNDGTLVRDLGRTAVLPGFASAHSHAFQRVIRGRTHLRRPGDPSDFWSWREAMYGAVNELDPDAFEAATRATYEEMIRAGITSVGEFHYVHHAPGGKPYRDPNELSKRVIQAAADAGIKLTLLEVFYATRDPGEPALPEQRRFVDRDVDTYLTRIEALRSAGIPIGIAPHSVRAVGPHALKVLADYASQHSLPIHAHVSEQRRENQTCYGAYGRTPTQLFADTGCLARPQAFTAVHAVHLEDTDYELLAGQTVCACPTTEADLGDGIVPAQTLRQAGVALCLGSDSNAVIDIVQEARLLEMNERLRLQERVCLADGEGRVAPVLLHAATAGARAALGRPDLGALAVGTPFDACLVDLDHPTLRGVDGAHVLDALLLSGTAAPIAGTFVDGVQRA